MMWSWKMYILSVVINIFSSLGTRASLSEYIEKSSLDKGKTIECVQILMRKYIRESSTIRVRICAKQKSNIETFTDTLDTVLPKNEAPIDLYSGDNLYYQVNLRVYFVDSLSALRGLVEAERPQKSTSKGRNFYIVVLPPKHQGTLQAVGEVISFCWENHIVNVNIIVEDKNGVVNLYTYFPFSPKRCNDLTPVIFKRFEHGKFDTGESRIFPLKVKNFWNCPLQAIVWRNPPFVIFNVSHGVLSLSGMDGEILKILAKAFNFTVKIISSIEGKGTINENAEPTGIFKILKKNKANLAIGNLRCSYKLLNHICISDPYYMSNMRIVVRATDSYSSLEMLFFPFDRYTWFMIIIFFFGRRLSGILSKKFLRGVLPTTEYHKRIHMIVYLFIYLMIRSIYEGSVFNFLHNRPSKHLPATLNEAISSGYKFLVDSETYSNMEAAAEINASLIVSNVLERQILSQMHLHDGKIGVFFLEDFFSKYLKRTASYAKLRRFALINENIFSKLSCIYLPKFSYMIAFLNRHLSRISSHGLVNKFYADFVNVERLRNTQETADRIVREKPTTLGMDELMGAFQIYFFLMGFCGIVFLMEIAGQRYEKLGALMEFFN